MERPNHSGRLAIVDGGQVEKVGLGDLLYTFVYGSNNASLMSSEELDKIIERILQMRNEWINSYWETNS